MINKIVFPDSARPAIEIARRIRTAGGEAYIIGGGVRDLCIGRTPKDFDLATSLTPDQVIKLYPGAPETGKSFGVVRVRLHKQDEKEIEVATYRKDGPYSDGRHPDFVEFTNLEEDVKRRDFTVNALAADPETGEVIDLVGGLADLEAKLIRAVGDPGKRFEEDKLRLIRAARFAHVLGFSIEPSTFAAIKARATEIKSVAMERVSEEMTKIFVHVPAGPAVRLLDDLGLLHPILPEVTRLKGVDQPPQFHPEGDVWIHTCMVMDELFTNPSPAVAWAALLHDIGKPDTFSVSDRIRFHGHAELGARMIRSIGRRLRFSNDLIERIHVIILEHQRFGNISKMRPGKIKNWAAQPHFEELLEVHRADCAGSHRDMSAYERSLQALAELRALEKIPARYVTGATLVSMGLSPGPSFKAILDRAFEAQLEGSFSDEESGMAFLRANLLNPDGSLRDTDPSDPVE